MSSKVREEVTRGQLKFILLLTFYTNIKNDPTEKVNSFAHDSGIQVSCRSKCRDTEKIFHLLISAWSSHLVLCSVCSLPGTVSEQMAVSKLVCSGESRSNPVCLTAQTKEIAPTFWVLLPRRASSQDLEAEACTALSWPVCSPALPFHCPLDGLVSS